MRPNKMTRHHLVPRSKGGQNVRENVLKLKDNKHRAFHLVFDNLDFPDQVRRLMDMHETCLQGDMIQDIERILQLYEGLEYHHGIKKKPRR